MKFVSVGKLSAICAMAVAAGARSADAAADACADCDRFEVLLGDLVVDAHPNGLKDADAELCSRLPTSMRSPCASVVHLYGLPAVPTLEKERLCEQMEHCYRAADMASVGVLDGDVLLASASHAETREEAISRMYDADDALDVDMDEDSDDEVDSDDEGDSDDEDADDDDLLLGEQSDEDKDEAAYSKMDFLPKDLVGDSDWGDLAQLNQIGTAFYGMALPNNLAYPDKLFTHMSVDSSGVFQTPASFAINRMQPGSGDMTPLPMAFLGANGAPSHDIISSLLGGV